MNFALGALFLTAFLSACASPGGGGGGKERYDSKYTILPDKLYAYSFVVKYTLLLGVKFEVQGGKTDAYVLKVDDFNRFPKNTEGFTAAALAKNVGVSNGALMVQLEQGSYVLVFDNPSNETIRVAWTMQYEPVGR